MQSIVPSFRPWISAWRSSSVLSGGGLFLPRAVRPALDQRLAVVFGSEWRVHLQPRVEALEQDLVGQREVVRTGLAGDADAARLGLGDVLHRLAGAQVLDVDAAFLVARDRGVAGDQRRLADARDAGQAEPGGDDALVHHAFAGERRVLLVEGDDAAAELLVLQRLAQDAGAVDGLAVVGEAEGAALSQLGHLGQGLALQSSCDAREEADGDAGFASRRLSERLEDRG